MRTTLKRGVGRGAEVNGNGRAVFPPGTVSAISRYRQPPRPPRSGFALFRRILLVTVLVVLAIGGGVAFGAVLWFDESVHEVQAQPGSDVAKAQGKTVDGLVQALLDDAKTHLDAARRLQALLIQPARAAVHQ